MQNNVISTLRIDQSHLVCMNLLCQAARVEKTKVLTVKG